MWWCHFLCLLNFEFVQNSFAIYCKTELFCKYQEVLPSSCWSLTSSVFIFNIIIWYEGQNRKQSLSVGYARVCDEVYLWPSADLVFIVIDALEVCDSLFQDSADTNPLIRALAVRTMGCIRVDKIADYFCDPLRRCLRVRLTIISPSLSAYHISLSDSVWTCLPVSQPYLLTTYYDLTCLTVLLTYYLLLPYLSHSPTYSLLTTTLHVSQSYLLTTYYYLTCLTALLTYYLLLPYLCCTYLCRMMTLMYAKQRQSAWLNCMT